MPIRENGNSSVSTSTPGTGSSSRPNGGVSGGGGNFRPGNSTSSGSSTTSDAATSSGAAGGGWDTGSTGWSGGSNFPTGDLSAPDVVETPAATPAPVAIPATAAPVATMRNDQASTMQAPKASTQKSSQTKQAVSDSLAPSVHSDEQRRTTGGDELGSRYTDLVDASLPVSQQNPFGLGRRRAGRGANDGSKRRQQAEVRASQDQTQTKQMAKPPQKRTPHRPTTSQTKDRASTTKQAQAPDQVNGNPASAPKSQPKPSDQEHGVSNKAAATQARPKASNAVQSVPRVDLADMHDSTVFTPEQIDEAREDYAAQRDADAVTRFDPYNEDFAGRVSMQRQRKESSRDVLDRLMEAADMKSPSQEGLPTRPEPELDVVEKLDVTESGVHSKQGERDAATHRGEIRRRFRASRILTQQRLMRPWRVRFEGDHFEGSDDDMRWRHHAEVQRAINSIQEVYQCTEATAVRLIQYAASLGVDNKRRICKERADEFTLSIAQAQALARQIAASQKLYGHPMGVVGEYFTIGDTKCYPCGYLDAHTLRELTRNEGGALHGQSIEEIRDRMRDHWKDKTLPDMVRDTANGNRLDQREQVWNFMRAAMDLDNGGKATAGQLAMYGVDPYDNHRTFMETLDREFIEASQADAETEDIRSAVAAKADAERRAYENLDNDNRKRSNAVNALMSLTGIERFLGTLNPAILGSGFMEGIKSQATTSVANLWLKKNAQWFGADAKRFERTDNLKDAFSSKQVVDGVSNLWMLLNVGGPDAVTAFASSNSGGIDDVTQSDVVAFLDTYVRKKEKDANDSGDEKKIFDAKDMLVKLSSLTESIMTGGGWLKELNAQKFLDGFLANMMATEANPDVHEAVIDAAALEDAMRAQGVSSTLMEMAATHQGRDALLSVNQLNMARRSPIAAVIETWFRSHGVTEFVFATFVDKYLTYGIKFIELYFPYSSTVNYLISRGLMRNAGTPGANGLSSLSEGLGKYERAFVGNTMGIDEANGLMKCLIYDTVQTGSTLVIAGLIFALHCIFDAGGDDDDEPDIAQRGHAEEYSFGGLFKAVPAWWSYDLIGYGYGLGSAMWAEHKYGNGQGFNILINNCADAMDGNAVFDTINLVRDFWDQGSALYALANDQDAELPEGWGERSASSYAEYMLQRAIKNFTPGFVNGYTNDSAIVGDQARDRSAYTYYGDDTYGWTSQIDDYDEVLRRTWAKNNLAYAWLLDLTRGARENEYNRTTGYLPWEMPVATKADPYSMYWRNALELPDDADDATKEAAAVDLIATIGSFSSPSDALAQGFILPRNARDNLKQYCLGQQILAEKTYLENYGGAKYSERTDAYLAMKEYKNSMQQILDNWVYNSDIPSGINRYEKLISDTQVNYVWKDTGETANALDFFLNKDKVQKLYTPQGNAPSSLLPFTTIRKTGNYNDETALGWQTDKTDLAGINARIGDQEVLFGQDKGARLAPLVEGSQDYTNTDMSANRRVNLAAGDYGTINRRSYVYTGEKLTDTETTDTDLEKAAERYGFSYSEFQKLRDQVYGGGSASGSSGSGNSYGGNSYSYGGRSYGGRSYSSSYSRSGGSGSSYSPKIYSAAQRVYNTTAKGLSVKSPYKASTTYLRPAFYTKGSREAYKRSDM